MNATKSFLSSVCRCDFTGTAAAIQRCAADVRGEGGGSWGAEDGPAGRQVHVQSPGTSPGFLSPLPSPPPPPSPLFSFPFPAAPPFLLRSQLLLVLLQIEELLRNSAWWKLRGIHLLPRLNSIHRSWLPQRHGGYHRWSLTFQPNSRRSWWTGLKPVHDGCRYASANATLFTWGWNEMLRSRMILFYISSDSKEWNCMVVPEK